MLYCFHMEVLTRFSENFSNGSQDMLRIQVLQQNWHLFYKNLTEIHYLYHTLDIAFLSTVEPVQSFMVIAETILKIYWKS